LELAESWDYITCDIPKDPHDALIGAIDAIHAEGWSIVHHKNLPDNQGVRASTRVATRTVRLFDGFFGNRSEGEQAATLWHELTHILTYEYEPGLTVLDIDDPTLWAMEHIAHRQAIVVEMTLGGPWWQRWQKYEYHWRSEHLDAIAPELHDYITLKETESLMEENCRKKGKGNV